MEQQSFEHFEHNIAYITAKITIQNPDATTSIGTGFFYRAPLHNGTSGSITLLISNRHVFGNPKGRIAVELNRQNDDGTPRLGDIIKMGNNGFERGYYPHPNPDVDLAAVNYSSAGRNGAFLKCLGDHFLNPINYEKVAITPKN